MPNTKTLPYNHKITKSVVSSSSPQFLTYTLTQLSQRAGWQDNVEELPLFYGNLDDFSNITPTIIVIPTSSETWHKVLTLDPHSLTWLPTKQVMPPGQSLPIGNTIPVLFWGKGYEDGSKPFAEKLPNGSIIFYADIIAATFFMLSRWEETVLPDRDQHGRFPATASVAYKQGFLDRPIVDEYALILRAWLKVLLPQWKPKPHRFRIKLSHDVDSIQRFNSIYQGIRTVGHHILKQHNIRRAANAIVDTVASKFFPHKNSDLRGIYHLAKLSSKYQLESAFYFKSSPVGTFDSGYAPTDPLLKPVLQHLKSQGFEIGFHPGYNTFCNSQLFKQEKETLEQSIGMPLRGGRQHYLRFRVPDTWRLWESAGLEYDSTLGYADYEGFRAGTCHFFHPFDIQQNREMDLLEAPLIVMDGTLKNYRQLTPLEGKIQILELAQRCQKVEGTFTLLWHNTSLSGDWQPWVETYNQILEQLGSSRI